MSLLKRSTTNIPFQILAQARGTAEYGTIFADFAREYKNQMLWIIPQMLAEIAELKLERVDGKISGLALFNQLKNDPRLAGMLLVCMSGDRSLLLPESQTKNTCINYSSLVPLVMSAFKKYQDVPYSAWDRMEAMWITEKKLFLAMTTPLPGMSNDELLQLRINCLTPKSGIKEGVMQNAAKSYRVSRVLGHPELETLSIHMLLQTWCAHPSNRTEYMILDPESWDNMPEPLVNGEVFMPGNREIPW